MNKPVEPWIKRVGPPTIVLSVMVGIRSNIYMKYGQASWHRESNLPGKSVCGIKIKHIRLVQPADWYRRCLKCFDKQFAGTSVFEAPTSGKAADSS